PEPGLPGNHAAGGGLREPHAHFHGRLAGVAPDGVAHIVSAGDVGRGAAAHIAVADAALLRAVPHGRRSLAILMIGVHPAAGCGDLLDVDLRPDAASQIADVDAVGTPLGGGVLPQVPDFEDAIEAPVCPAAIIGVGSIARLGARLGARLRKIRGEPRAVLAAAVLAVADRA